MEEKVNQADKRLMKLRTRLEETLSARELLEARHKELNEQWRDSGNGSTSTEEGGSRETNGALIPVLPALLSPLAGGENQDDVRGSYRVSEKPGRTN